MDDIENSKHASLALTSFHVENDQTKIKEKFLCVKLDFSIIPSLIIKIFYDTFEVIILMLGSLFKINNKFEVLLL